MPTYTMELWRAVELLDGDIGLDSYPIFEESYREQLNAKILEEYDSREIGMETAFKFRHALRRKMNQIMPYYNKLYNSELIVLDPMRTIDMKTVTLGESVMKAKSDAESETKTKNKSKSRAVQSTAPQVMLAGNGDYASSGADSTSESDASGTGKEASESETEQADSGDSHTTGYQGSPAALLDAYRATLMNIDMLVIGDLAELFMGVWDNGADYSPYTFTDLPNI